MTVIIKDMPKLESPFVRKMINKAYVVTPEICEGLRWVFEGNEDEVVCTEKLDGTNVSIVIENGEITQIYNRLNKVPFIGKGQNRYIVEALINSYNKGYMDDLGDGQHFGEVIGEKFGGAETGICNPYKMKEHLWIPFTTYARKHLCYKSWHKYPKTFENISNWFRSDIKDGGIFSLFMRRWSGELQKPEGVVFHNLKTGEMAKLRLDMFDWWQGKRHKAR